MKFTKDQIAQLNTELNAVAVAGAWGTGKSLFALTRPTDGKVIWLHTEPSGANYAALYPNVTRIEVNSLADLRDALTHIEDKVAHIILDTIAPVEDWIFQDVTKGLDQKGKPMLNAAGNKLSADAERFMRDKSAAWGEVKRREQIILAYMKDKADAITITSHLRAKYIGSQPSPVKEPRAKEVVYQFVSLFLMLERVDRQPQPAGVVIKSTLLDKSKFAKGEIAPVLPPRLPKADWETIWRYIETPVDMTNLSSEELHQSMSEEESLRLMAKIASDSVEE